MTSKNEKCLNAIKHIFSSPEFFGEDLYIEYSKRKERGWKIGHYMVKIPKKWSESHPCYENNTLNWIEEEKTQNIPTTNKFYKIIKKIKNTLAPFEKKINTRHGEKSTSYLRIYQSEEDEGDEEESGYTIRLMVIYDKEHIPFPIPEIDPKKKIERLERINTQLSSRLHNFRNETEQYFNRLRRINMRLQDERRLAEATLDGCYVSFQLSNAKYMQSYRNIINEFYKESGKNFECPVCYEEIKLGETFTSPCNHVFCNDCAKRCKNTCPMCRNDMCCILEDNPVERPQEI
jgi:hypothetical protein